MWVAVGYFYGCFVGISRIYMRSEFSVWLVLRDIFFWIVIGVSFVGKFVCLL